MIIGVLLLNGLVLVSPSAHAEAWVKNQLGKPYGTPATHGLKGISIGDGDNDNQTEIYTTCEDNAHVYQFRATNGKWASSDLGTLVTGTKLYAGPIVVGDADDNGKNEVYACVAEFDTLPPYPQIYQFVNGSDGWTINDLGDAGLNVITGMAIADGNNDSRSEIYASTINGHIYQYSKGSTWSSQDVGGASQFLYQDKYLTPYMNDVAVGDGDNDGNLEVYGAACDNHIYRFNYTGSSWNTADLGAKEEPLGYPYLSGMLKLAAGDADNDGKQEVYGASYINATVWEYRWNASSQSWCYTALASLGPGATADDLCIADGNSDGENELYIPTAWNEVFQVKLNDTTGKWELSSVGSGEGSMNGVAVGGADDTQQMAVYSTCSDGVLYQFYTDRTPPANPVVWSDTHPVPGTWYSGSVVHVLWKDAGYDISGIDGYSVAWDRSATTVPDAVKGYEENIHDAKSQSLADGTSWYFHIRARDNSLNWNASAAHFGPIWIDTTPPNGLMLTINDGADYTNDKTVHLSVQAADPSTGSGLASMAFSNDGKNWSDWEAFCATRSGWDLTDARFGGNDSDGMKYVYANVRDLAGNEVSAENRTSDSIFLDRVAPVELSIVINDDSAATNSDAVSLNLSARDPEPGSGLHMMRFSNDGIAWSNWTVWNRAVNWSVINGAGGTVKDGNRTVYFRVMDRAGNIGGPASGSIIFDRQPPGNLSITINDGAGYTNLSTVSLAINASDPEPGSSVSDMTLANAESALGAWESFAQSKSGWSLTSGAGGTDADGIKAVYLKVRDKAGNPGGPVNDTIFLDRARPGSLSILINGGAKYTNSPVVNLALNATDPEPASSVYAMQFSNDGNIWTAWETFSKSKSYTLPDPDGTKTVYFRVEDRAGNVADAVNASIILDTASPVISNVRVIGITDTSAVVTWSTDEDSDSGVDYGLTSAYGSSGLDPVFLTSHSLALGGLSASTIYHFRVYSKDRAGSPTAYTGDYMFITSAAPDTTPPGISNIQVSGVTDRLAVIGWTTSEPANSTVDYGTEASVGTKLADDQHFILRHVMTLTGLSPSTTYYFQVSSTDPSGNGPSTSKQHTFKTLESPDTAPPIISNVKVNGITDRLAIVNWETDEPADGIIDFGATTAYGRTASHAELLMHHELTLSGLSAGTTYHFKIECRDATGNGPAVSGDFSFTTTITPDITPPSIFNLGVEGITGTSAVVLWETDEMAGGLVEYGTSADYGLSSTVFEYSLLHSQLLQGLKPDTTYHLRVQSTDPSGNTGTSGDFLFKTKKKQPGQDTSPPVISGVGVTGITDTRAVVFWYTDELADSDVDFGNTTGYGLRASDPAYVPIHYIVLEGLRPSTTYYLRVKSSDVFGNGPSLSGNIAFTTAAGPDMTPPKISDVKVSGITNTSVIISWKTDEPANGIVEYGARASYGRNLTSRIFVLEHSVQLTGLSPSTTYHFRAGSMDPSGNPSIPGLDMTFSTLRIYVPPGPGPKPKPATETAFPWAWVALAVLIAIVLAGAGWRAMVRSKRPVSRKAGMEASPAGPATGGSAGTLELEAPAEEMMEVMVVEEAPAPRRAPVPAGARDPAGTMARAAMAPPAGTGAVDWGGPSARASADLVPSPIPAPDIPVAAAVRLVPAQAPGPHHGPARLTPVRVTRCSGCGSQVPIFSTAYPVRITCPNCGRSGMYKGPRN